MKYKVPQKTIARPQRHGKGHDIFIDRHVFFSCNYALACVNAAPWIISPKKQTHLHTFKGVHEYETN